MKILNIIVHHSLPVSEYDDPGFLPRMFPTLYAFSIGGFEDANRKCCISFQAQAD